MKYISSRRKTWLARNARNSAKIRLRSVNKSSILRNIGGFGRVEKESRKWISIFKNGKFTQALLLGEPRVCPKHLSLVNNFDETALFLKGVRESLVLPWRKGGYAKPNRHLRRKIGSAPLQLDTYWDFSCIEKISPEVALIVASEYDRIRKKNGWLPGAVNTELWDKNVLAMLSGVGFFSLIGIDKTQKSLFLTGNGWKMLRFRSGDKADGQTVSRLLSDLGVPAVVDDPDIYAAIIEALTNTIQHAYPSGVDFDEPHVPAWWLTGYVVSDERRVRISVFDQGLTIPGTLTSWEKYPIYSRGWRRLFGADPNPHDTTKDGMAIALAMTVGRSSTKKGYRGRGLPLIEATVNLCRDGAVRLYSRNGFYERKTKSRATHSNRKTPIEGTLITWDWCF